MTREGRKGLAYLGAVSGVPIDSRSIVMQESEVTVPRSFSRCGMLHGAVCVRRQRENLEPDRRQRGAVMGIWPHEPHRHGIEGGAS